MGEQQFVDFGAVSQRDIVQRRRVDASPGITVGAALEEHLSDGQVAFVCGRVKRRATFVVGGIDDRATLDELGHEGFAFRRDG